MLNMKRYRQLGHQALTVIILAFGMVSHVDAVCEKKLKFAWANWAPYHYINDKGDEIGVYFDVVKKIMGTINCQYDIYQYPWKRLIYLMERNEIDVVAGIQPNSERAKIAYFSKPYGYQYIALFVRKGESKHYPINSLKELSEYKFSLGVRDNVEYGPEFNRMLNHPKFNSQLHWLAVNTNPRKLAANRIDGLLMDPVAAPHVFRQQGVDGQLERHPMPFLRAGELTLMLNKKSINLTTVKRINEVIDELDMPQYYLSKLLEYENILTPEQ